MLEDKILEDYKEAMKKKDRLRSATLSFLRADLKNFAIEKRKEKLEDDEVTLVIKRQIKQHKDSIEQFEKGSRLDLVQKEKGELEILSSYLPEELSIEKIKETIEEAINITGAVDMKDMGRLMKELVPKIGGRADGKLVSDLVKERLSQK